MPLTGGVTENADKTKNFSITGVKENDNNSVTANAFVQGYRSTSDPTKLNAPVYGVAGGSLTLESGGHSAGVAAKHIPNVGNQVTGSTNMNLIHTPNHKLDVNAFTTQTMPKAHPNFATHGGGVDYAFKEKKGASASVAHTPMFNKTDNNVGGFVNLHKTPTSSFDLNLCASKSTSPFSHGQWQPGGAFIFNKKF
ncbi:defense protein 3-like [Colias croceus]|uniref:defense protein 3-like n=1 Tax=Colias crocea TaxID=72248 RepID=UPI001E27F664|nr:defense protein 3-like [Colias croceus]